jgi:uncharacterized protein
MKKIKLAMLPPMACEPSCGECCGIVPVTETEFQRIARYVKEKGIVPVDQGPTCPLFQNGGCAVYAVRPLICHVFGHVERMPCPRGHNVNIEKRQVDRLIAGNGEPTRLLHELVPHYNPAAAVAWAAEKTATGEPGRTLR